MPVLIILCLPVTVVGRLAILDKFWTRIVKSSLVWRGLYCRDYGCGPCPRCVWRTLDGRAGAEACLYHLGGTHPAIFSAICRRITAIPGRSREELLEEYQAWRRLKGHHAGSSRGNTRGSNNESSGVDQSESTPRSDVGEPFTFSAEEGRSDSVARVDSKCVRSSSKKNRREKDLPASQWHLRARCVLGLSPRHHRRDNGGLAARVKGSVMAGSRLPALSC